MALNQNVSSNRPDHTKSIVGDQGAPMNQEPNTGKQVVRKGAVSATADIDVGTVSAPHDLIADGDYDSGSRNAGGAEALAGEFVSDDSNAFNVEVDWLNDDDEVTITHAPASLQSVTDVDFNLVMRSDRFKLRIEDVAGAGQNKVHGSANAH